MNIKKLDIVSQGGAGQLIADLVFIPLSAGFRI